VAAEADGPGNGLEDGPGDGLDHAAQDRLSATFAALADPTRRAILSRLAARGEATVNDLAAPFPVSLQAVSKHLKVLEAAGLITRGRDAQYRPCRLRAEPLDVAAAWLEQHRRQVEERLERLEDYLKTLPRPSEDKDGDGAAAPTHAKNPD
jgi:DNA-binding transcriptional ArsR family regulator